MNVLLLRGLMREARHWGDFTSKLENKAEMNKVLCLDLPGVGTEQGRFFSPSIKQVVLDIRSRFQTHLQNNKTQDWIILGISLGGMIALKWVELFPNDFKKIILMNISAQNTGSILGRLKPESMLRVLKIFKENDPTKRELEILKMVSNLKALDKSTQDLWIQIARSNTFDRWTAMQQMIVASQFKAPQKISIPSLVLTSRGDRMVDYRHSLKIAEMYGSRLDVHANAGHELALDDSSWCVERICDWVRFAPANKTQPSEQKI